ncbi:hypothetical protein RFI_05639 [Reticulomyxa filosa]|uniref:MsrB domain-containing protein n=1 Tax=Reticulomyxa filosa TaxID=46433 RepID=X6NZT2_RETFI|nr:hypothetical protein RFI_05639 [Reticulomyxa filosa]|eukprot:ETO31481.1 hypothetical protein RFI_05639 [Reticulomyxa filosa]
MNRIKNPLFKLINSSFLSQAVRPRNIYPRHFIASNPNIMAADDSKKTDTVKLTEEEWKKKGPKGLIFFLLLLNAYYFDLSDNPLYSYQAKFSSHCGWPAFDKCFENSIKTKTDKSHGMVRVEIMCAKCDGHLGHVFEGEGYNESDKGEVSRTDQRHCVNSISIKYVKGNLEKPPAETELQI